MQPPGWTRFEGCGFFLGKPDEDQAHQRCGWSKMIWTLDDFTNRRHHLEKEAKVVGDIAVVDYYGNVLFMVDHTWSFPGLGIGFPVIGHVGGDMSRSETMALLSNRDSLRYVWRPESIYDPEVDYSWRLDYRKFADKSFGFFLFFQLSDLGGIAPGWFNPWSEDTIANPEREWAPLVRLETRES